MTTTSSGIGNRFKTTREALGLTTKEAAARLRINEKYILMLEEEDFSGTELPLTFTRGYIRSYGKLLSINDAEIDEALQQIKVPQLTISAMRGAQELTTTSAPPNLRYLKLFSTLIFVAWLTLTGIWWYTHSTPIEVAPILNAVNQNPSTPTLTAPLPTAPIPASPAQSEDPNLPPQVSDETSATSPNATTPVAPASAMGPVQSQKNSSKGKNNSTSPVSMAKSNPQTAVTAINKT